MNIAEYISIGHDNAVTLIDLKRATGIKDSRVIREMISQARHTYPILNMQDGKGYFLPIPGEEDHLVRAYLKQEQHRAKSIFWSLHGCRDYLKSR